MDLVEKYLVESKDIIRAIQRKGKKIANDPFDINKAYFELDGSVYKAGIGNTATNMGKVKDFIKQVKTGKIRAKLVEGINELSGRGMAKKINIPKKDEKKVLALLDKMNIKYEKDAKGNIYIGDDDIDRAEEWIARKLNILI